MTTSIVIPTRQRLRHATTPAVRDANGKVLVAANDNFAVDPATRAYRVDTPIERLAKAKRITATQLEAGNRFYADFYAAGLSPLGAVDYGKPMVDGTSPAGQSDYRAAAGERYRRACLAIGPALLKVIDRVVLREMQVEAAGRDVSGRADDTPARSVGMWALTEGLDVLAAFYKLVTPRSN